MAAAPVMINSSLSSSSSSFQLCSIVNDSISGIKKVTGGSVTDSKLVKGVAFKKTFSYAGFEMQPKTYNNPKVLSLNIELELKAERDNAECRIDNVEVNFN